MAVSHAHQVLQRFWTLGSRTHDLATGTLTAHPEAPAQPWATFLHAVRPDTPADLDTLLAKASEILGQTCPRIVLDARTPQWAQARLVERDWQLDHELHLVLPADASGPTPGAEPIRPAQETDWTRLRTLYRLDHVDEDAKAGRPPRPESSTDQGMALRRTLTAAGVRYFVVEVDNDLVGFVAGWPGDDTGVVEDLFVHPDHRHRGFATGLIGHAVAAARTDGDRPVVIGAQTDDTPKHLYHRLGFSPTSVATSLLAPAQRP